MFEVFLSIVIVCLSAWAFALHRAVDRLRNQAITMKFNINVISEDVSDLHMKMIGKEK